MLSFREPETWLLVPVEIKILPHLRSLREKLKGSLLDAHVAYAHHLFLELALFKFACSLFFFYCFLPDSCL